MVVVVVLLAGCSLFLSLFKAARTESLSLVLDTCIARSVMVDMFSRSLIRMYDGCSLLVRAEEEEEEEEADA